MAKVILEMTLSLDGFIAGPHVSLENAMGVGGDRLHHWIFDGKSEDDENIVQETIERTGSVIIGKTMFDVGLQHWNDTPYPLPTFVLTHHTQEKLLMKSSMFIFVTDGIESALSQAKGAADDKNVLVMGGANIAQQFIKARLLDELWLHIVPVLLGGGTLLFDPGRNGQIELERFFLMGTQEATHMKFRVIESSGR